MYRLSQLNFTSGVKANGRRNDSREFTMFTAWLSSYPVGNIMLKMRQGMIAANRVKMERISKRSLRFRNPSMTYCPANVVVMQLLCAEANKAKPQKAQPPFTDLKKLQNPAKPT
mmetsp:Transcript_4602/g.6794  ORF Transcript_4602/g.6794 Transcript_4602/m.6794 type:complete len:114 (-) Transcript_4602:1449-1790(-)